MIRLDVERNLADGEPMAATVLLEHGNVKVRRLELARGARIPPCRMHEDVVFVVLAGRVTIRSEGREAVVAAPGAVFVPGGATTRSMEAVEDSLVLGVLCRCGGPQEEPEEST